MTLHFVLVGPAARPLADALGRRGHRVTLPDDWRLAPWRGGMAAADAVVVDAGHWEAAEAMVLARASTGGLIVALLADGLDTAQRLAAGAGPVVNLADADFVLSAAGGLALRRMERDWQLARAVWFAPVWFAPVAETIGGENVRVWDLIIPALTRALPAIFLEAARAWPAGRFAVVEGCLAPTSGWPANVEIVDDAAPFREARWSLHPAPPVAPGIVVLDPAMLAAAACGAALLCEPWPGLDGLFPERIACVPVRTPAQVVAALRLPEPGRRRLADAAPQIASIHGAGRRAEELEALVIESLARRRAGRRLSPPPPASSPRARVVARALRIYPP